MGKEFEPKLKASMNSLQDELNIPDLDLIRPKIILAFSHKTSKLVILTSMNDLKNEIENIEKELLKTIYLYSTKKKSKIDR